ncbi:hypothetical protein [Mycoplasmopsis edwardii]|nr:hypothetical protein [Mycoplasmopsis edwardii]
MIANGDIPKIEKITPATPNLLLNSVLFNMYKTWIDKTKLTK